MYRSALAIFVASMTLACGCSCWRSWDQATVTVADGLIQYLFLLILC